jgi:hypothetical protein
MASTPRAQHTGHAASPPTVEVSPALIKAAQAAWARYASVCTFGGAEHERAWTYTAARQAENRLWNAQGAQAAKA